MTERKTEHAVQTTINDGADEPVRYPTNHVVGVLDTDEQLESAHDALLGGGFLDSEVSVLTGTAAADRLRADTGRKGLANLAIRIAERLGITNDEMSVKAQHEAALRDGRYLVLVSTPTDERKAQAARLLEERGAHTLVHMGRYAIEGFVPPSAS